MTQYHYNGPAHMLDHGLRTIRPAALSDSRFIYNLSMDPSVRGMSTRGEEFSFEEHDHWYREKLTNGLNRIWIIEVGDVPAGQVRYGKIERPFQPLGGLSVRPSGPEEAEIAIAISPAHQGKGYALDLLTTTMPWAACDLGVSRLVALVLVGNLRSKFLFEHAGFTYVCNEQRMGKDHWRYERSVS